MSHGQALYDLTARDRELLALLSLNGRMGLTELAGQMHCSKQATSYHLDKLLKEGIIESFYAVTNVYRLGITHYRVFLKLQQITPQEETSLHEFLTALPSVSWVLTLDGDYDLFFVVWSRNILDFQRTFDQIMAGYGRFFLQKSFSIATQIEYLPYRFLRDTPPPLPTRILVFGSVHHTPELSEDDRHILGILNHDGRASWQKIARELGCSPGTARRRVHSLEERGIIIGYNLKLHIQKAGYLYQKVLLRLTDTAPDRMASLRHALLGHPGVIYLLRTIGPSDFEFELISPHTDTAYSILREIRLNFSESIHSAEMVLIKRDLKFERLPWVLPTPRTEKHSLLPVDSPEMSV